MADCCSKSTSEGQTHSVSYSLCEFEKRQAYLTYVPFCNGSPSPTCLSSSLANDSEPHANSLSRLHVPYGNFEDVSDEDSGNILKLDATFPIPSKSSILQSLQDHVMVDSCLSSSCLSSTLSSSASKIPERKCESLLEPVATHRICSRGQMLNSYIMQLCAEADRKKGFLSRENRARLTFLKDTVDLLLVYVGRQVDFVKQIPAYEALLNAVSDQLEQTLNMMRRILQRESTITDNFDVFELTLRRYHEQMQKMFPLPNSQFDPNVITEPSLIIEDLSARKAWEEHFSKTSYYVDFDTFIAKLLESELESSGIHRDTEEYTKFVQFLRYFVNFPNDNMTTTYKWNLLTRLFGPYESFLCNFSRIALGRGFLGLTNRIKAYEILTMKHAKRTLLIRLSRTEPEFLAFSYKNSKGEIGHQINKDNQDRPISVDDFLRKRFPGYTLVSERLDVSAILGYSHSTTLCDYANTSGGYIV